jgi:hypothetical protein
LTKVSKQLLKLLWNSSTFQAIAYDGTLSRTMAVLDGAPTVISSHIVKQFNMPVWIVMDGWE